jgi:hypothetical protein
MLYLARKVIETCVDVSKPNGAVCKRHKAEEHVASWQRYLPVPVEWKKTNKQQKKKD